jgi:uracil-DNA glycosylase family protein
MARRGSGRPDDLRLAELASAAASCRDCDLWERATQTVFGTGPAGAALVLIGEQPGDQEDKVGEPFVGPAGRVLDDALAEAGIDRTRVYVTNAVKHFKWQPRGKRRIHQRPNRAEVLACRHWLESELEAIGPDVVLVALGATAGQALFGSSFRVGAARGRELTFEGRRLVATIHPSAILRAEDDDRARLYADLVADLRRAAGSGGA